MKQFGVKSQHFNQGIAVLIDYKRLLTAICNRVSSFALG
jgi:hypothetical protein